jgi:RNA 2',3'-cyclic 3'-phosphodiesterase
MDMLEPSSDPLRVFFAIWPTEPAARALHDWAGALATTTGGKVMPAQTIHLTLAFLGSVDSARVPAAIDAARQVSGRPTSLPIEQCRYWPRSRIVWVGPRETPVEVSELARSLAQALRRAGFALEKRAFAAHVTLLRKARGTRALPSPPAVSWPVDEFTLVRSVTASEGSRYEILARFAL